MYRSTRVVGKREKERENVGDGERVTNYFYRRSNVNKGTKMPGKSVLPGSFTGPWELFFFSSRRTCEATITVRRVIPHREIRRRGFI